MAIFPTICLFYYLARTLMHDVAREFARAEAENNYREQDVRAKIFQH